MEGKIRFGTWEAVCLLVSMLGTKVILNYPRAAAEKAGTAGWLMALFTSLLAIAVFSVISGLYKNMNEKDIIDIGQYVGGAIVRTITGLLVAGFMFLISYTILRLFSEQMKTLAFYTSPISFVSIFFLSGMIFAGFVGIEPVVRFMAVLVPVSIGAYTIYIILLAPNYNITNVLPLLGNGLDRILINGVSDLSGYLELLFLFLIVPFIGSFGNFRKIGYTAIILSSLFLVSLTFAFLLATPYPTSLEIILPAYYLGTLIDYGRFFQRIEPLFIVTWATMGFMYLSAAFYFLVYTIKKTFRLEHVKPLVLPFAVLVFTASFFPGSQMENTRIVAGNIWDVSGIIAFGVTIILLIAANIKKRREKHVCR